MAQNVKKVASKNLKKPKVAENSKSCQNSKKLPKISKVAEKLPSNLCLSLFVAVLIFYMQYSLVKRGYHISKDTNINEKCQKTSTPVLQLH